MKIEAVEGKIVIEPESNSEQELINSITEANENLIFQLQKKLELAKYNGAINILHFNEVM